MLMKHRMFCFVILLGMASTSMAGVAGRWAGPCDFPGWPQVYGMFTSDGESGQLSVFQANLLDQPVDQWKAQDDVMSFNVDIHGSIFTFDGRAESADGDRSLSGSITAGLSGIAGQFEWSMSPVVADMADAERWSGILEIQGIQQLDLILDMARDAKGRLHVDISIPAQKVAQYPLEIMSESDSKVFTTLHTGVPATMTMDLGAEQIMVAFQQGSFQQDIIFTHDRDASITLNRPQEPKPPFPYQVREVLVNHPDGHVLAGTITTPPGAGPHPAAILISGSGLQDRNEEIMGHKPFLVIADHLTRNGIAVLRADDRGVGGSQVADRNSLREVTSVDFASDINVLFEHLAAQPDIDPERIGLIGHSEGGYIGPMVADQRGDVAFLVLLAGTGRRGLDVLKDQNRKIMEVEGMNEEDISSVIEEYERVMGLVIADASVEELREPMRVLSLKQINAAGLDVEVTDALVEEAIATAKLPWLHYFMVHDPGEVLERIDVPIFAINGTLDVQVLGHLELPVMEEAVRRGGGDITTRLYPGLNHLFQPAVTGSVEEYDKIEMTVDPQVLADISEWIRVQVASHGE